MLELVDLQGYGARGIDQLSGGQRQRVALARALAVRPRALLLDEPLTALDAKLREQLRVEIDRLLRRLAITAIYVTHDQAEAMALGDRIFVMENGRIAQAGTPQEIYFNPATAFVADFIGTMNRISGEAVDGHLVLRSGRLPLGAIAAREVMFRPEDVRIVAPGEHHFSATVISSFFLGDHTRLLVDAGGSRPSSSRPRSGAPGRAARRCTSRSAPARSCLSRDRRHEALPARASDRHAHQGGRQALLSRVDTRRASRAAWPSY